MDIIISKDYESMSTAAAEKLIEVIKDDPKAVLGLATGSTPIGMYQKLVEAYEDGEISFKDVITFNLDEYCGLEPTNDQSYRYFMQDNLFDHVDIVPEHTHLPSGLLTDDSSCSHYDELIDEAGGIDIQVLGLGNNGHIGFNEPSSSFPVGTHVVELQESTIEANSRLFDSIDDVPRSAVTMGIGTIMKADKILLLANGEGKAKIIAEALNGPVVPSVPASILQLHPDVTIIVDEEAGSLLS